jgi:hypothetical protein
VRFPFVRYVIKIKFQKRIDVPNAQVRGSEVMPNSEEDQSVFHYWPFLPRATHNGLSLAAVADIRVKASLM